MINKIKVFDAGSTAEVINTFIDTLPKTSNIRLETTPSLIVVYYTVKKD